MKKQIGEHKAANTTVAAVLMVATVLLYGCAAEAPDGADAVRVDSARQLPPAASTRLAPDIIQVEPQEHQVVPL